MSAKGLRIANPNSRAISGATFSSDLQLEPRDDPTGAVLAHAESYEESRSVKPYLPGGRIVFIRV